MEKEPMKQARAARLRISEIVEDIISVISESEQLSSEIKGVAMGISNHGQEVPNKEKDTEPGLRDNTLAGDLLEIRERISYLRRSLEISVDHFKEVL